MLNNKTKRVLDDDMSLDDDDDCQIAAQIDNAVDDANDDGQIDDDDDDDVQIAATKAIFLLRLLSVLVVMMMVPHFPLERDFYRFGDRRTESAALIDAVVEALEIMTGDFYCFGDGAASGAGAGTTSRLDVLHTSRVWNRRSSSFLPADNLTLQRPFFNIPIVALVVRDKGTYPMFTSGRLLQLFHVDQDLFIIRSPPNEEWIELFSPPDSSYSKELTIGLSEGLSVDTNDAASCEGKAKHPIVHNKTYRNDAADETCRLFSDVAQSGSQDSKSSKIIMKTCRLDLLFGDDMKDWGTIKGQDSPRVETPVS